MGASAMRTAARAVLRFARAFSRYRMEAAMLIAKKASDLVCAFRQIEVGAGVVSVLRRDGRKAAFAAMVIATGGH